VTPEVGVPVSFRHSTLDDGIGNRGMKSGVWKSTYICIKGFRFILTIRGLTPDGESTKIPLTLGPTARVKATASFKLAP
jgi:hypothetical protein